MGRGHSAKARIRPRLARDRPSTRGCALGVHRQPRRTGCATVVSCDHGWSLARESLGKRFHERGDPNDREEDQEEPDPTKKVRPGVDASEYLVSPARRMFRSVGSHMASLPGRGGRQNLWCPDQRVGRSASGSPRRPGRKGTTCPHTARSAGIDRGDGRGPVVGHRPGRGDNQLTAGGQHARTFMPSMGPMAGPTWRRPQLRRR